MAPDKLIDVYLNDHLAGAAAGVDLARKLAGDTAGTPLKAFLDGLVAEIDADRHALEDVMKRLGVERQTLKQAGAWLTEKVGRLRFSEPVTGSHELTLLMEMETLSLGIEGKMSMWQTVRETRAADPRLAGVDLDGLIKRAQDQAERLEPCRREAATRAFAG
jgi:hypothetical protein